MRGAARRFDEALVAARRDGKGALPAGGPRASGRTAAELRGTSEVTLRATAPDLAGAAPPVIASPARPEDAAAAPPVSALRAAVRALPAAIEAARLADGAQVSLSLGRALGVELRGGANGVELTLHPAAALAAAASAELPGLVAALRARGVRVVRAAVGATPGARRSPGPPARQAR